MFNHSSAELGRLSFFYYELIQLRGRKVLIQSPGRLVRDKRRYAVESRESAQSKSLELHAPSVSSRSGVPGACSARAATDMRSKYLKRCWSPALVPNILVACDCLCPTCDVEGLRFVVPWASPGLEQPEHPVGAVLVGSIAKLVSDTPAGV